MIEQSESIAALAGALSKAQGEFPVIPKTKQGKIEGTTASGSKYSYTYHYADLADVRNAVQPMLTKYGLALVQFPGGGEVATQIIHESGEWIRGSLELILGKVTPQGQGSAITYGRRYAFSAALNIVTEEDDDGNGATKEAESGHQPTTTRQAPQQAQNRPTEPSERPTDDPRISTILEAAKEATDNDFLVSLSTQWTNRGSLTDKQIESGFTAAIKVLDTVPAERQYAPEEERFAQ